MKNTAYIVILKSKILLIIDADVSRYSFDFSKIIVIRK